MKAGELSASGTPVALYVHFPFCLSVCPYCDFVVYPGRAARGPASRVDTFIEALVTELRLRARRTLLASVYLGGGTPSLMSGAQVARVLDEADRSFGIAGGAEVTIEVNPGAGERGDLARFRAAGVTRVSIGAQGFDDGALRRLGRRHSAADIAATVAAARSAGIAHISLDLLYDVPGQTLEAWRRTLDAALALEPDHISAYALALDDPDAEGLTGVHGDHLPLREGARRWRERARRKQDDDRAAAMYEMADTMLEVAGLRWYEISNWARRGRESRHNLAYWQSEPWEAVGPGAHRFDGRYRSWNAARVDAYLSALGRGELPPGARERARRVEVTVLALRTAAGVSTIDLDPEVRAWAAAQDLLEGGDKRVRLTRRGRLLSNELFARLIPNPPAAPAA